MAVLAATVDALAGSLPHGSATLLLGVMRDKEVDDMLQALVASDGVALVALHRHGRARHRPRPAV